jgi:hypothetical protein
MKIYAAGQASFALWVRLAKMFKLPPSALESLSFQQMALFRQNGGRRR